jgi:hypothetical protein
MVFYADHGVQRTVRARTDFCLVNVPMFDANQGTAIQNLTLDRRLAELTCFFTVFSFNVPLADIMFAHTMDEALAKGTKDYLLIQNCGHIFYGGDELAAALNDSLDACEFLMGHIMDRGGYFYLHDECLLINRRAWERLGKPSLGLPTKDRKTLSLPERSPDNVHDNYTPLWLKPTGQTFTIEAPLGYVWNGISESLAHGLTVKNWSNAARRFKRHSYAYYGATAEWLAALDDVTVAPPTEDVMLQMILDFLRNTPSRFDAPSWVFVFNSENDLDIPVLRYRKGLDTAFMLASGFKTNRLLETVGFHDQTHVVVYDYSKPALALRQAMVEMWNGYDFPGFFAMVREKINAAAPQKPVYVPEAILNDPNAIIQEFAREMGNAFRSMEHWIEHWQRYRALPHTFVHVDVLRQSQAMVKMLEQHTRGHTAIWISDMFNSPNAVGKFSFTRRRDAYNAIGRTLAAHADSHLIIGSEPRLWLPA